MATENILMAAVAAGGDRQNLHERIRRHSIAAAAQVKEHGRSNDLIERLKNDPAFEKLNFDALLDATAFVGRAPQQVDHLIETLIKPIRGRWPNRLDQRSELEV